MLSWCLTRAGALRVAGWAAVLVAVGAAAAGTAAGSGRAVEGPRCRYRGLFWAGGGSRAPNVPLGDVNGARSVADREARCADWV